MKNKGGFELRQAFADRRLLRIAGAHDGLTARLAEEAGFDGVWASSFEISAAHGVPDMSLLGLAELLSAATTIRHTVDVPVIADCDTGFGGPLNAVHAMRRCESAGISAISIEDKAFPKRNSFMPAGHELVPPGEFAVKIEAAARARCDPATVLIARTEAFVCGRGVDEVLSRCHQYVDAGADAVLVHSKQPGPEEILAFLGRWRRRAPVVVVPTTYASWSADAAAEAGADAVIYANQGLRSMVQAIRETWRSVLATGACAEVEPRIATIDEIFELSRLKQWLDFEQ
ncbi:isocitrate lyase/phosphoenolpyruvate mutase family protein [Actinomadura sp. 9N215]|uniref:isocitrate lyase/phosphoenolpyruvate mutase family protein n=1 Tax=Actinomadura sp. 9N215 TaxID=3375150 RepID=UPI0037B32E42